MLKLDKQGLRGSTIGKLSEMTRCSMCGLMPCSAAQPKKYPPRLSLDLSARFPWR
jgi:hypothetical protein